LGDAAVDVGIGQVAAEFEPPLVAIAEAGGDAAADHLALHPGRDAGVSERIILAQQAVAASPVPH
jgi:hypothetical protein